MDFAKLGIFLKLSLVVVVVEELDVEEGGDGLNLLMDAGVVEKFAVAELRNFGGIFKANMLSNVTILSLPVSLIVLADGHWLGSVKNH